MIPLTRADIVLALFDQRLGVVRDVDLDEAIRTKQGWEDSADDDDGIRVALQQDLHQLARDVVEALDGARNQVRDRRAATGRAISEHTECLSIIGDLTMERDDLLAGLDEVRHHCHYETYEGRYGERQLEPDTIRALLVPRKTDTEPGRSRALVDVPCPECGSNSWEEHEEACSQPEEERQQRDWFRRLVASHISCQALADARLDEIDVAWGAINKVATFCDTQQQHTDYGTYLDAGELLGVLTTPPQ